MTLSFKSASLVGASLLLLASSLGVAEAMPVSSVTSGIHSATGIEQAAYLRRKHSTRTMRRKSPNQYCQSQPSRCH